MRSQIIFSLILAIGLTLISLALWTEQIAFISEILGKLNISYSAGIP
ncbi:MAG: hypothetical protein ACTSSP_09540 [Candidatus Asgardarchaeia archaeon]|nr:hypothetical protein [Candidatus Odinarchaeota archaeon]